MNTDFLADLKAIPHWVAYKKHWDEARGKTKKIPIDVGSGKNASVSDPHTWSGHWNVMTYVTCEGLFASTSGGIGFVLDNSNDYAVIDLDDVIDDNGNLKDWAAEVVRTMNSYTELSPSGHGLHIWFTLSVPYSELCTRNANHEQGIEIYDTGHYFTVTEKP